MSTPPVLMPRQNRAQEVQFSDYIAVIKRRWRTLAIVFTAAFIGVAFFAFEEKPVYEASATLYVKDEISSHSGVLGELTGRLASTNPIDSEIEILKSRTNAEEVVKRLRLNWRITPKEGQIFCKLLEFNSNSSQPYQLKLLDKGAFLLSGHDGKELGVGRVGELFRAAGVTLLVGELKGNPGNSCRLELLPLSISAEQIRGGIKASIVGKDTNIIRISYIGNEPQFTCNVVNALVQVYRERSIDFKTEEASRGVSFVEEQLKVVRKDLEKAEGELQAYKSSSGVIKIDTEADDLIRTYSHVEKERAVVTVQKKQIEFALASLKDSMRRGIPYTPAAILNEPMIVGMAGKLSDHEVHKKSLVAEFTKDHPQVRAVQAQIDESLKKIRETYETSIQNLTKQENEISRRLGDYERRLNRIPAAERDLARFMRVAKVNADIYTFLLQKLEEANIAKALISSNIKIVDPAVKPRTPVKSQKKKKIIMGLLISVMAGVGLVFFQDYLDKNIKDSEQAKHLLGWPLLASIPHIIPSDSDVGRNCHTRPDSFFAEEFRGLRTTLLYSPEGRKKKIFMVTSALSDAGKSTVAANLAIIMAQTGARVVLLDCNLRTPRQHEIFNLSRTSGLSAHLNAKAGLENVISATGIRGLDLVSAGSTPVNPTELLGSEQMDILLAELKQQYDIIVIDAPSVLGASDTPVLSPSCDAVIVLIEPGHVPIKAAQKMRELLLIVDAPVTGIIINYRSSGSTPLGNNVSFIPWSTSIIAPLAKASFFSRKGFWLLFLPAVVSALFAWFIVVKDPFSLRSQVESGESSLSVAEQASAPVIAPAPVPATAPVPIPAPAPPVSKPAESPPPAPTRVPVAPKPMPVAAPKPVSIAAPKPVSIAAPKPVSIAAPKPSPVAAPKHPAPVRASVPAPPKERVTVPSSSLSHRVAGAVSKHSPRLKELPGFVPTANRDASYSTDNPGWERYFGKAAEFRVLRDNDRSIKTIQIMDTGGNGIVKEFIDGVIKQVAGGHSFALSTTDKKAGFTIEKGEYADNLQATHYLDTTGSKVKGFSLTWK